MVRCARAQSRRRRVVTWTNHLWADFGPCCGADEGQALVVLDPVKTTLPPLTPHHGKGGQRRRRPRGCTWCVWMYWAFRQASSATSARMLASYASMPPCLGYGPARRASRASGRGLPASGRRSLDPRPQRLAERDQGDRELVRQRMVRPAVGMGQGNELPHGPLQGGPLGSDLPLGLRLRVRHLSPGLSLDLDHLCRQRVDGLDDPGTQGLHAGGRAVRERHSRDRRCSR